MKKKRIAVFAIRQLRRNTGAVRNALEQAEYIREMGYEIQFCSERVNHDRLAASGFRWIRIPRFPVKGYIRRVFFDWCVQRYIRRARPDLFISHGDACSDDILVIHNCVELAYERLEGAGSGENNELIRFHRKVIGKSRFRYLIANSEFMKRDLVERYRLDPSRVGVFYQGVDTDLFNADNHDALRREGRRIFRLPDQAYVVGLVTSGDFHKRNVDFFLEVAARVRRHFPEIRFAVVGKDSAIERYRNHARQSGLEDAVVFVPPVENVQACFHALDIFAYPAKIEEYGRVVLEALACGTPAIIGSAVGASEIMLQENIPAVLEGWDVEQWVKEIVALVDQPEKAREYSKAGAALARKYSQENRARALQELLDGLLGSQGRS